MKIGGRLTLGFGLVVVLVVVIFAVTFGSLQQLALFHAQSSERAADAILATRVEYAPVRMYQIIADAIINRDLASAQKDWNETIAKENVFLGDLMRRLDTEAELKDMKEAQNLIDTINMDFNAKLLPLLRATTGIDTRIQQLDAEFDQLIDQFSTPLGRIEESLAEEQQEADEHFKSVLSSVIILCSLLSGIVLIVAIFVGVILTRSITRPLSASVAMLERLAGGDLGIEADIAMLKRRDELGQLAVAMNSTLNKLHAVVTDIQTASNQVSLGSAELADAAQQMSTGISGISSSSQQLSQGATEQAASAEEVSASIEQMSANIRQNADNATQTEGIAAKAAVDAKSGAAVVKDTADAMRQIAEKIAIIEEIARQTNMLSLNASIEAARAGEHGKGFAVVASEVGKLAERSKTAAAEISGLSKRSVEVADKAGIMLSEMVPNIQRTADLIQEISIASREQDAGTQQINKAITQLDTVIQNNASLSEEFSASSEEIAGQSEMVAATAERLAEESARMKQAIAFFRLQGRKVHEGTENTVLPPKLPKSQSMHNLAGSSIRRNEQSSVLLPKKTNSSTAIVLKNKLEDTDVTDDDFTEF